MNVKLAFLVLLIACTNGCSNRHIQTSWRPGHSTSVTGNKILVAVVFPDKDTLLRKQTEEQTCADLRSLGYEAVSSSVEFGQHGLSSLEQEETYLKLCEHGIDVIMTIALLNKDTEAPYLKTSLHNYSSLFFYNRIWSYKRIHMDQRVAGSVHDSNFFFETFLFDLKVLQPVYFIRTTNVAYSSTANVYREYINAIISHLRKKKVVVKRAKPKAA